MIFANCSHEPAETVARRLVAQTVVVPDQGYLAGIGPRLSAYFAERGLLLRPLGNTLYLLPPYCVSEQDLDELYDGMLQAVSHC